MPASNPSYPHLSKDIRAAKVPMNRSPNKDSALNFINAWTDTSDQREENVLPIAILNDIEKSVPTSVAEALEHYSIKQIPWSRRHESLQLLAA